MSAPPEESVPVSRDPVDAAPRASRWEDYIDIFIAPAHVFQRRAHAGVGVPLATLLGAALALYYVMLPANRIVMLASVADNPQALEAMERFGTIMQILGSLFVPVTYVAVVVWSAALLWVMARFVDLRATFSRTVLIATYAAFVLLLSQLVVGVLVLIHGDAGLDPVRHLSTGVLRLADVDDSSRVLVALLRRVDLFAIWQAVLWGIGVRFVLQARTAHAATIAAVAWLLYAGPAMLFGLIGIGINTPD